MISYYMGYLDSICDDDMIVHYAEVSFWFNMMYDNINLIDS
jgi:hypothetical protein